MSFHQYRLSELYSNPSGSIQFIELAVGNANGESRWAGVSLSSTRNGVTNTFSFPLDLSSTATANTTVLIATQGFADLGVVTPNFIIPAGFLFTAGGSLNFGDVDTITYPPLPDDGVHSVTRTGESTIATPKNFAGATGSLPSATGLTITGTAGNDTLTGTASNERIEGLVGADTLKGGGGNDTLHGGADDDVIYSGTGDDALDGGDGYDYLYYTDATTGVVINIDTGKVTGGAGSDSIAGFELLFGSRFDDIFMGGDLSVGCLGGDGNDTITGGASNDHLEGNGGNDVIDGKDGRDVIAYYSAAFAVNVNLTTGMATGGLGNDTLSNIEDLVGSVFDDTLTGSAGDNRLEGGDGNDSLSSTSGDDTLDGGSGLDTVTYTQVLGVVTLLRSTTGSDSIEKPNAAGSDTLLGIERLQFADANLAFDLEGNAGQTYRLYQAAFNRTPDLGGLGGWIAAMDTGQTPTQIATSFMASAEFQTLYGANPGNEQLVALLYTNALHRTADAEGLSYWVNQLSSKLQTRAQVLVNFSESTENKASVLPAIANGILYANTAQAAGPAKGQTFVGTSGADTLVGSVGNDSFQGGGGNDAINGGAGIDVALYNGNRASHTITGSAGSLTIAGGSDGTDTLTNVERLKFDDIGLAFDTSGNAGQAYRLYQAAFNRIPDIAGLSGWIKEMDAGLTLQKVASGFIGSTEFKNLLGVSATDAQFVDLMYANVLHRPADSGGAQYWLGQMHGGTTRETVLIGFSESVENQAALIGVIQSGIELLAG
jgi:Ca2+-binding RTX toxin-like protein